MKGLAMDCRTLRRLVYSLSVGFLLCLAASVLLFDSEYLLVILMAITLIPVSVMMSVVVYAVRCSSASKTSPKEKMTVAVKNAIDTLQLLELSDVGKCIGCGYVFKGVVPNHCPKCGNKNEGAYADDTPMAGSYKYCLSPNFLLYCGLILYAALLLLSPMLGTYLMPEDANLVSATVLLILMSVFLFAFWLEYHTCCKRKYRSASDVTDVLIVRCPFVSYIEMEQGYEPKL